MNQDVSQYVRHISLFKGLDEQEIKRVEKELFLQHVEAFDYVCKEGDCGDFVCFVIDGELDVIKKSAVGSELVIAHLQAGDSVGEMALVDNMPRSASIRALLDTELLVLTRAKFDNLQRDEPHAGVKILRNIAQLLSGNLRNTSEQLVGYMAPLA